MAHQVLIIDDEEVFVGLAEELLKPRGFSVAVATSGEEAFNRLKSSRPDVIMLDVNLPEMDGLEIIKRLKNAPETSTIPVVICSAHLREKATIRALESLGAQGFVHKPCKGDELAGALKAAMAPRGK